MNSKFDRAVIAYHEWLESANVMLDDFDSHAYYMKINTGQIVNESRPLKVRQEHNRYWAFSNALNSLFYEQGVMPYQRAHFNVRTKILDQIVETEREMQ